MRAFYRLVALLLCAIIPAYAVSDGNSWDKVRYNGGTFQTKVDPKDWDNHLTVTSSLITFKLKDDQQVEIDPKSVTGLSYGQEAHRRVGTMVALGILVSPLALFGLMHKTRLHFIGIEYKDKDGKGVGLLLQGHKDNYRAILTALEGATGAPLSVSEKDREYVPGLPNTNIVSEKSAVTPTGSVAVKTVPEAADVAVDGNFSSNSPATLKLSPGKHTIKVTMPGYKDWSREITVTAGSDVQLNVVLEK